MQAMQGSASEYSYAQHSGCQNYNFHVLAKPRLCEAIKHLACKSSFNFSHVAACGGFVVPRTHFAVADLGCSHGRNTLNCAEFVVRTLLHFSHVSSDFNVIDIQYFFSDLPSNDFNALFQSLEPYLHQTNSDSGMVSSLPKFFAAGVPGSFYGQLFPKASLNLVICSYSLQWLSQVPPSLVDRTSPAWNGGHTWISSAKPSKAVTDAYARQSEMDVKRFLRNRAEELASGGILFLLWVARSSCTPEEKSVHSSNYESVPFEYTMEFLDHAWKEMVDEGLIASEEMDMFNVMMYFFDQQELESAVKDVPELRVLHMESINDTAMFAEQGDRMQTVEQWVGLLASLIKPAVDAHVGKSKADELFKKLKTICLRQDCFHARVTHTLVVASLQRV